MMKLWNGKKKNRSFDKCAVSNLCITIHVQCNTSLSIFVNMYTFFCNGVNRQWVCSIYGRSSKYKMKKWVQKTIENTMLYIYLNTQPGA